jgi:hypothetical protein
MSLQKISYEKLLEILTGLGEIYNKAISPAFVDIYWEALKDYTHEGINRAVQLHIRNPDNGQFFPKPADFMKYLVGNADDMALLAWTKVDKAVRQVGPYKSIVFDDKIIHAVINDMGGWIGFGNFDESEWPFKQNEFVKRYRGYDNKGITDYPRQLTGVVEAENVTKGHDRKDLVYFGDQEKAKIVHEHGGSGKIGWRHITNQQSET